MKKTLLINGLILSFTLGFIANDANAVNRSVVSGDRGVDSSVHSRLNDDLQTRKTQLETLAEKLKDIYDCLDVGAGSTPNRIWTSGGCVTLFDPETDPSGRDHSKSEPAACSGDNYVQYWTGSSWTCKELRLGG